ncbi:MAG: glucoamylase family protein [Verrucomicrobiota bacterium]
MTRRTYRGCAGDAACRAVAALLAVLCFPLLSSAVWTGTDEEFIQMVESNNWEYFRYNQAGPLHMFRGSGHHDEQISYDPLSTCAGDGFGIAALVVGAYRGWTSDEYAYTNVLALLNTYDTQLQRDGCNFYSHFYSNETGVVMAEYSAIDSTWFICGALMAAQYFKGTEVETVANRIYGRMNYRDCVNPDWNGYSEFIIMNIVGAGSPTNGWLPADSKDGWETSCRQSGEWGWQRGPLFWYQWPQAFVDFRHRVDGLGTNHFQVAVDAMMRQRQQCIDLHNADPAKYPDLGTNGWGMTSALGSLGYLENRPFCCWSSGTPAYGYIETDEEGCDSGTLVPISLPSSMAHVPSEARAAMKHIYDTYDPTVNVYDLYSFKNGLNTGTATSGSSWLWDINAAMDYGCNAIVVENFRSGMPWKYFMSHSAIVTGMQNCGFTLPNIAYHDNWNDGSDPNVWTGSTTFANSDGTDPTAAYESISSNSVWVNGYARKLVANGSGDVVRFELKETDESKKDLLSFWLRGTNGGESFDLGLRDAEGHEVRLPVTNYVAGGSVPTNWTRVRVPLKRFAVSGNPNNDARILFLGDVNVRFRAAGTVYLDDLAFVDDDLGPAPPGLGAACIDGRVYLRWGYSSDDDVVGYHLWRRPDAVSGFTKLNTSLIVADHDEIDAAVESQRGEDYYYVVQCQDRNGNAGSFSSVEYEQQVLVGRHRDVDWGDGQNPNTLGGSHGRWGAGWGNVWFERQLGWSGKTNWIRHMSGDTWDGVYVGLNAGSVSSYEALAFWLKQEWGANTLDVGLKGTNGVEVKVPITRYTSVTNGWRYVVIPLIDFKGVDLSGMDNVSFTFSTMGNVYLDGLRFIRLEREAQPGFVMEGENCGGHTGGSTNDFKWGASQAYVLGYSWATNTNDDAWWAVTTTGELNEAYLDVRYACGVAAGRTLDVLVNSERRASVVIQDSGGWGDEASQFKEETVRLGLVTNTSFLIKLLATNAGAAVNLDRVVLRSGTRWFREAEHWDTQSGSGGADYKPGSSGGQVLGYSWGGAGGEYAEYTNIVLSTQVANAWLRARYGQNWGDGRLIRVYLDGTNMGSLAFSSTGGWLERWCEGAVAELPLATVGAGTHRLRLEAVGSDEDVNVDWLRIAESSEPYQEFDTDSDGIPDSAEALFGTSSSQADTDGDGVADLDEISRVDGYLTQPTNADTDADTMRDGDELWAGSDPTSSTSAFCVASTAVPTNGGILIRWGSISNRQYTVSRGTNLAATAGGFSALASNIAASPPQNTYTDAPAAEVRFYRVGVQR